MTGVPDQEVHGLADLVSECVDAAIVRGIEAACFEHHGEQFAADALVNVTVEIEGDRL